MYDKNRGSDLWAEVCKEFGIECTSRTAYDLFPDDIASGDYFFGWYWSRLYGKTQKESILFEYDRTGFRRIGFLDAGGNIE